MTHSALRKVLEFVWSHPANRGARGEAVLRAIRWQIRKRLTRRHFDLRVFGGLTLRCYPNSILASSMIYAGGLPDYHEMNFIRRYLRPGEGFIDIGANIGVYTLLAASIVGNEGRVESFEPGPEALGRLRENVAINRLSQVTIHSFAVGDCIGKIRFQCGGDATNRMASANNVLHGNNMEVQCVTLDGMFKDRTFSMGKIDIEGAEPLALIGASEMIRSLNPPVWMLEINGLLNSYGYSEKQLAAWLAERGYRLALFDANALSLTPSNEPWKTSGNSIAVAESKWDEVVSRVKQTAHTA